MHSTLYFVPALLDCPVVSTAEKMLADFHRDLRVLASIIHHVRAAYPCLCSCMNNSITSSIHVSLDNLDFGGQTGNKELFLRELF